MCVRMRTRLNISQTSEWINYAKQSHNIKMNNGELSLLKPICLPELWE